MKRIRYLTFNLAKEAVVEALGGPWTTKKLAKIRAYLVAYQKVLLKQAWVETVYIDAFSGSGQVTLRGASDFTDGSALQAIGLEMPFVRYHLIEKSRAALQKLRQQVQERHPDRLQRVEFHAGDANKILPPIVSSLDSKKQRAVIFADPFGMQLDWSTVEAIARQPIVDFWLLVPTGMGIIRLAPSNPKRMQRGWAERLDRFLGESDWRNRWYEPTGQTDLFDNSEEARRTATLEAMEADFRARLKSVFPCVADNVLHLKDGNRLLFSLMFACSNPSPTAQSAAKRIADHLLKE